MNASVPPFPPLHSTRLLDQVRERIRYLDDSFRTEHAHVHWVRAFMRFHDMRHPVEIGAPEVEAFLSWLASERNVAVATHKQALSALVFCTGRCPGSSCRGSARSAARRWCQRSVCGSAARNPSSRLRTAPPPSLDAVPGGLPREAAPVERSAAAPARTRRPGVEARSLKARPRDAGPFDARPRDARSLDDDPGLDASIATGANRPVPRARRPLFGYAVTRS